MYQRYSSLRGWKFEILSISEIGVGGYKEASASIKGDGVFSRLKFESGVHRVQRVPATESSGRIHTSAATVAVLPEVEEVDIKIEDKDLRIDTYRASGAGGQHVNTTDSAVRITNIPSKTDVQCQNNRSQHKNKEECMSMLKSKLYELELKKLEAKDDKKDSEKTQIGWGNQIRSYVLHPYKMVKDLRTQFQTSNTTAVLDGNIDEFIYEALVTSTIGQGMKIKG